MQSREDIRLEIRSASPNMYTYRTEACNFKRKEINTIPNHQLVKVYIPSKHVPYNGNRSTSPKHVPYYLVMVIDLHPPNMYIIMVIDLHPPPNMYLIMVIDLHPPNMYLIMVIDLHPAKHVPYNGNRSTSPPTCTL